MAYIKFLDSDELIPCSVILESEHVVSLSFPEQPEVNASGFDLFLDSEGEIDIGGDSYHGYQTIYRNDDVTAAYNGYQLSDDKSVYVEPVVIVPEPETPREPTAEELAEQERQQSMFSLREGIETRKQMLKESDYIIVKLYEYSLVGKACEDYDLDELHEQRQVLRDEINSLERELETLVGEEQE